MATSSHSPIGILGYGRFGRALAELFLDAAYSVIAFDPVSDIPPPNRANSIHDLVRASEVLFLAIPVHEYRNALSLLRPHVRETQLVVDVASVKRGPVTVMREVLGGNIPWIATHPLFGPSSIALGERPLDVVVCPNELHPSATARIRSLYESIGCQVSEQAADDHDRLMAETHALAFFVAKGMLDIGAGRELPHAPPSFRAMAQTIESTRSDAGHLFRAIQRDNPYAADAREQLLEALSRVHAQLNAAAPMAAPSAPLGIPDLGKQAPELRATRDLIDEVDFELLKLLARRAHLARRAGTIKAKHGREVRDPDREHTLIAEREEWAERLGLDPDKISEIFDAILTFSRDVQNVQREQPNSTRTDAG